MEQTQKSSGNKTRHPNAPQSNWKKLKLFDDDMYYQNHRYHCFITNQTLPAKQIWEQYKERADAENRIQELKYDFGLEGFMMKEFFATEAAMRFITVAYNLMSLYKHVATQTRAQQRLSHTIRINWLCSWKLDRQTRQQESA